MNNQWSLKYYVMFLIIFVVLIVTLSILMKTAKGNNNRKIIGYFNDFKTNHIIALSLIIINFMFLTFNLIMKMDINFVIIFISIMLILIATSLSFNIKNVSVNNLLNLVNIFVLYIGGKVNIIRLNSTEKVFYYLQILINFLGIVFFMFSNLKFSRDLNQRENDYGKTK